ncbi:tRNA lysidine(34) synthetase TilS [Microbulbifer sp. EKSA008]|uniref:tRNA lysidine(34) synthetase TilS n=1 Tax=Microbulbifer sp. EKSA008 TaxID=3243367 RepID=UPI00404101A2
MKNVNPSEKLPSLIKNILQSHPASGQLWVGFSGGLDSTVLLHLLVTCQVPVRALHIHHGLNTNADIWLAHCKEFAENLAVPFTAIQVTVDYKDGGLEQGARRARYAAFNQVMSEGDQILLGHHADDQAETFLLRLMRGAGVLGLASMSESRTIGDNKYLLRPLLGAGRKELEQWAEAHGLSWIEDDSNADEALERNFLRHRVVPLLNQRWGVSRQIARAAENLRESADLLSELALADLEEADLKVERFGESLALPRFFSFSEGRRKNLMRHWVLRQGGQPPESALLNQALFQVTHAAEDAQLEVNLGGCVVRRFRNRLYLTPELAPIANNSDKSWHWDGRSNLALPAGGILRPSSDWPVDDYRVCYRRGGERAHPVNRSRSQTLKKLLQEWALEPWLRDRVPLVFLGDDLVAVAGLFSCKAGCAIPDEPPGWRFFD